MFKRNEESDSTNEEENIEHELYLLEEQEFNESNMKDENIKFLRKNYER